MREWALSKDDPLILTLVSDARLGPTDYTDDHIWELSLGGDPHGLVAQTTFGLRARAFRILPRFTEGEYTLTDPADFASPLRFECLYPNLITLHFSPFPDIDVRGVFWVPAPHVLAGRYTLANLGNRPRQVQLELLAQLTPASTLSAAASLSAGSELPSDQPGGQRMAPCELHGAWVLAGQTAGLFPLLFLTGGPQIGSGSYPSLLHLYDLPTGENRQLTWVLATTNSLEESFSLARHFAARRWEAELAYLDMVNSSQVEIYTGQPDWDAAFMLAQRAALSLVCGPTAHLPHPSFVQARQPDQGYSPRGDGTDFSHLWNGQSPLEAYYLSDLLLPGSRELVQGLLRNFLAVQNKAGDIDWKPGLAGQRSFILATPLLATLAWRIYETTGEHSFLAEIYPGLLRFIQTWFSSPHDRDGDGIPEWDHPAQADLEDHPLYSRWHEWSYGIEISAAENPALSAFLFQECRSLEEMAELLGRVEGMEEIKASAEKLRLAVEIAWRDDLACYEAVDRDTHFSTRLQLLGEQRGTGHLLIGGELTQPARLLFHASSADGSNRQVQLIVHGKSASGQPRLERIPPESFKWLLGRGVCTGERVYQAIERVEIQGLAPEDSLQVFTAGFDRLDCSALLPLWAGILDAQRAEQLVKQTITNPARFWHKAGLPVCLDPPPDPDAITCQSANLTWNLLIGQGLLRYGYRQQAAELVSRLMAACVGSLKAENGFRRYYHADTGQGSGERNALQGLAPVGLFLDALGVRIYTPERVLLSGFNPFPWPVTVKYRGLTVLRMKESSTVMFPDGQTVMVADPAPRLIALESRPT